MIKIESLQILRMIRACDVMDCRGKGREQYEQMRMLLFLTAATSESSVNRTYRFSLRAREISRIERENDYYITYAQSVQQEYFSHQSI